MENKGGEGEGRLLKWCLENRRRIKRGMEESKRLRGGWYSHSMEEAGNIDINSMNEVDFVIVKPTMNDWLK